MVKPGFGETRRIGVSGSVLVKSGLYSNLFLVVYKLREWYGGFLLSVKNGYKRKCFRENRCI